MLDYFPEIFIFYLMCSQLLLQKGQIGIGLPKLQGKKQGQASKSEMMQRQMLHMNYPYPTVAWYITDGIYQESAKGIPICCVR